MSSAHQFQRKRCFGWGFGDGQRCAGKNIAFGNSVKIVRSNCRTVRMFLNGENFMRNTLLRVEKGTAHWQAVMANVHFLKGRSAQEKSAQCHG